MTGMSTPLSPKIHPAGARVLAVSTAAVLTLLSAPHAGAQEEVTPTASESSSTRKAAPNTDDCPHAEHPGEPVTTSERLAPGQAAPETIPAVQTDVGCGVTAPEGFKVDRKVIASAWLVADADTGEIVAMKDPHGRYRPASIIKVLLALVAIEELDLKKVVRGTQADAGIDGSSVGIGPGGKYSISTLLHGLLLGSGNDAAHALAQQLGGDEEALRKVNAKAQELGATSTYAASYSGLDAAGMQTSPYDLGLMYQAAFNNPTFARIVNTESIKFPGYGDMKGYELWNDNQLFLNDPDGIGGKTGYTDDANHTFVGALDRDGRRLMAIVLDTTIDSKARAWEQAQKLLHEAYKTAPGDGVGELDPDYRAAAESAAATVTEETSPQETNAAPQLPAEAAQAVATTGSLIDRVGSWVGWAVVGGIAVLVALLAFLSLRRR